MRRTVAPLLLTALLLPLTTPAADPFADQPDPYARVYAVSGSDRTGAPAVRLINLTYHKTEKIKDMAKQKQKEKERYSYGDYTLVGEPTIKQNCAGLVTDRLGPAELARPFVADVDQLFAILKTFGEPVWVLRSGDVAVWTKNGVGAGHVGIVVGRNEWLKPVILTKDGPEGTYEFAPKWLPVGMETWNPKTMGLDSDLDPLVKAFGPPQFWRCDLKALHWEEVTFRGAWATQGGDASLEGAPAPGDPEGFVLKRLVPDDWSKACELVGRFRTVPPLPGDDRVLLRASGKMACRSTLAARDKCGEMAQWVDAEAWLEAVPWANGKSKLELHTSTACPSFIPCRWEIGASQARQAVYYRVDKNQVTAPPCPSDQKGGGKPLLFLREKTFETFDPATKEFKPGREGKGPNSWWKMDERSFHQEHNTGMIVDASWDPVPEALAPMQKYPFTVRAKVSGPGSVEIGVYPVMDTGSWSITLKESSGKVKHPALNVWVMGVGKEEGVLDAPEAWMTLEIQVAGASKTIDLTNAALEGSTGDLSGVTDLFLTLNCMVRGQLTWGWSKAQ